MTQFYQTISNFALGEVSPDFFSRSDLNVNSSAVATLTNMDVVISGGIKRRNGTLLLDDSCSGSVLVPFVSEDSEKYLCVLGDSSLYLYQNDALLQTFVAPWVSADLNKVQWAQRLSSMIFVHEKYKPKVLQKNRFGVFELVDFAFDSGEYSDLCPRYQFDDSKYIALTYSVANNVSYLDSNVDFFSATDVGLFFSFSGGEIKVIEYISATQVKVAILKPFTAGENLTDVFNWYEWAFSAKRGWPKSVSFHQNRLVFAGTTQIPNGVWFSKTGSHFNFDVGTGLDDEAIYLSLLSSQKQEIITIVSSVHLEILTSVGEWAVSGEPLTPENVQVRQYTSVGSYDENFLMPVSVGGSSIFVSRSGKGIRELVLDGLTGTYSTVDLAVHANHLMIAPKSIAYDLINRQVFVVMNDGSMAVLTMDTDLDISAWSRYITDGDFLSVCFFQDSVYVIVERNNQNYLEKFSSSVMTDSSVLSDDFVSADWLWDEFYAVYNSGFEKLTDNADIDLAELVYVGLPYSHSVSGIPVLAGGKNLPKKIRLSKLSLRLYKTWALTLNFGHGDVPVALNNEIYVSDSVGFSGDVSVNVLGWSVPNNSLWSVVGDEPLPIHILSVMFNGVYVF